MKECVELLFARGLVKVLVATETFAMVRSSLASRRPAPPYSLAVYPVYLVVLGCEYAGEMCRV